MADYRLVSVAARKDIFTVDDDSKLGRSLLLSVALGLILAFFVSSKEYIDIDRRFTILPQEGIVIQIEPEVVKPQVKIEKRKKNNRIKMKPSINGSSKDNSKSGIKANGNRADKVNSAGLLRILLGKGNNSSIAGNREIESYTADLDKSINNMTGVRSSGTSEIGRRDISGPDIGKGWTDGGLEGGDGIEALLQKANNAETGTFTKSHKLPMIDINDKNNVFSGNSESMGGRSPEGIRIVVMNHMGGLRAEYNKRLRDNPYLKGKIAVRFTINPAGHVTDCRVLLNTMNDLELERLIVGRIKTWQFESCVNCGMATVTYPFVFSQ